MYVVGHPTHKERDDSSQHDFEGLAGFKESLLFHLGGHLFVAKDDDEERQKETQQEAANETGCVNLLP